MIEHINGWIDETNKEFLEARICCARFKNAFHGFYSAAFLENSFFVVTDEIPKPDFPELRAIGFGDFIDMPVRGISYKNTYYIARGEEADFQLHFHELVHVAQWEHLGALNFIRRYMKEIQDFGYDKSPLETMAYGLDRHYAAGREKINVQSFVTNNI
ncbi:hypothetical protein [Microbulbifer celer]|uniref:DUF4157 domain-containing protein n=1 Tax=Microbulbifer celer TaxID=435905 RepID=A0ABW3UAQ2_9GAMM|nr:hypothetical protein [Microbulbifer celer]UFN56473.1 hypothetical protein LPW13_12940 [Microbulbifer celer]